MNVCDVLIVGGGPVGSYLAAKLAKNSVSVILIDKKKEVGKKACSGLISTRINDFISLDSGLILNRIKGAKFNSANSSFDLLDSKVRAYVVDRVKFDQSLLRSAVSKGVRFFGDTCYKSHENCDGGVVVATDNGFFKCKVVVGADGAGSQVRMNAGLCRGMKQVNGIIGHFDIDGAQSDYVELFYDKNIVKDFFAWKIPRGNDVEIGLASSKDHMESFRKFAKRFGVDPDSAQLYAHPINFGLMEKVVDEGVALVGDAACQVKPFSGGGIIYGFICAEILADILSSKEYSYKSLLKYERLWREKLGEPISKGLAIRNLLDSLDDDEMDEFFSTAASGCSELLDTGDMDFL